MEEGTSKTSKVSEPSVFCEKTINKLVEENRCTILSESENYLTLQYPKTFNWIIFILLSLLFNIFGLFGYIIYYVAFKKGKIITYRKENLK